MEIPGKVFFTLKRLKEEINFLSCPMSCLDMMQQLSQSLVNKGEFD